MKKSLLFVFSMVIFTQSIFSLENPKVYSAMGDEIYDNLVNIEKLKSIDEYSDFKLKIDHYSADVNEAKILGLAVESGQKKEQKLQYLSKLRKLSSISDYFLRSVEKNFYLAIKNTKNKLFISLVNTKLLDIEKNKKKILTYYKQHENKIDSSGVIQNLLDEEFAKKNKKPYGLKNKKRNQEAKIKRMRENDKYKQEQLEKKLSQELKLKKEKIREEQEKALFN